MSLNTWRHFNFFDLTPIKDPSPPASDQILYSDPSLTAICPGREGSAFFANADAIVKEFTSDMQLKHRFAVHDEPGYTISKLKFLTGTGLLLSVSERQGQPLTIQLWDMNKIMKDERPHCHAIEHVTNGSNTFPLSAFAISKDYSILGFGFADGTVILLRGDIIHDRGARQRVVYNSHSPITGLEFHQDRKTGAVTLYIVSVTQVLTVPTTGKNPGKAETILDKSRGASLGCVSKRLVDDESIDGDLIVARDDEISYYNTKLRGSSFVFDVPKKLICPFEDKYLVVTTSLSASISGTALGSLIDSTTTRVLILDTVNKYVAYSGQILHGVREVFVHWDQINLLSSDGVLYSLKEKTLDSRLDLVKQRHLYDFAIQLGKQANADTEAITKIQKEYGDYLYQEGEIDEALTHYIEAINLGQTSEVILKYRDSQHIGNLTKYLEALQSRGKATKEHTTLLLNSYAKLKEIGKLTGFIKNGSKDDKFDFETAIKICRQSGYFTLAAYLAATINDCDLAFAIKLRDLDDYKWCVKYVRSLEVTDALRILIQYSRTLLEKYPMETTALLILLFTGKYKPKPMEVSPIEERTEEQGQAMGTIDNSESGYAAPVLQSYRAFVTYMSTGISGSFGGIGGSLSASGSQTSHAPREVVEPSYQPPRPRLIFSSFLEHPNEFVIFLEACLEYYVLITEVNEKDKVDILSTLFEMYLTLGSKAMAEEEKKRWFKKAEDLAVHNKTGGGIDQNTIQLLCHLSFYRDSDETLLTHDEGFRTDLFRSCVAVGDVDGAISVLHKYGDQEKELYPLALKFFISAPHILEKAGDKFNMVLNKIKSDRIMSPLEVIQMLSTNSVTSIGHVREFLIELISSERTEMENNDKLAESYKKETQAKRQEIDSLLQDPMIVQYTQCASCNLPLDLPAVHFACKHSYHQRCLANLLDGTEYEATPQCPICHPSVEEISTIRRAQEELTERNDLFKAALNDSDNKFKVLTDFIGRGALTNSFM